MTDNGFMGQAAEVLAAVGRVLDVVERAEAIGNERAVVPVADLMALIRTVRASGMKSSDEDLRRINEWVDETITEADRELEGVGTKARESWNEFVAAGGVQAAVLPTQALTMVRIGFLAGYPTGWFKREGRR